MGLAHLAVGLAAKPVAPKAALWLLLAASEALDFLFIGFLLLGIEKSAVSQTDFFHGVQISQPGSLAWSHGLTMSLVWSILFALIAYLVFRDRRTSLIVGLVVFSHWVLDLIVHPAELPLFFNGSAMVGFGLWTSGPGLVASIIQEIIMIIAGVVIYMTARNRKSLKRGDQSKAESNLSKV